jgi:tetratricopeptide (TPR) repeat protein
MRNSKCFPLVLGLLVSLFLVSGCGVKSQYITSAKIYLKLRPPDYDNAIKQLQLELEHNPENAEAHFLLGKIYSEKRMYPEMAQYFDSSLELSPQFKNEIQDIRGDKWVAMFNSGVNDADQDSLQKALEKFKMAIIIDPTRYEAYLNAAAQAYTMNDCDQAMEYSEKAYNVSPHDVKVLNGRAQISFNCKEYDTCLEVYRELLEMDPENVNAYVNMAQIFAEMDLPDSSKVAYDRIIEIDPEYKDAYFSRGALYLNEAIRVYNELTAVKDSMQADSLNQDLIERSQQLESEQEQFHELARMDFQRTVDLDPEDLEAVKLLAQLLLFQDKKEEAGKILEMALELNPEDQEVMVSLGLVRLHQNRTGEAIQILKKVVEINPENKEAWSALSLAYTKSGDRDNALKAAEKAKSP